MSKFLENIPNDIEAKPWPPLLVRKRHRCACDGRHNRHDRWCTVLLIALLIYLVADTIVLNVAIVRLSTPPNNATATLAAHTQQCLSQYALNAPINPSAYPCAPCLTLLQAIPQNLSFPDPQDAQQAQNAIQFCALKAVFDSAGTDGKNNLGTVGWLKDVRFCVWNGVACDGSGRVSSLQLTFPGVPASLPIELGSLAGLQTLQIIGNSAIPAGALPSSFTNLSSLSTLHIDSTSLTSLPDSLFLSLTGITTLSLVKNAQMAATLPASIAQTSLQNLVVTDQNLNNPLATLSSSPSLRSSLKLIDLSRTSLDGTIPSTIASFASLTELHLDSNALQAPLPPSFPPALTSLTLSNNTGVQGALPGALCASATLKTCDMRGTGISVGAGCGPCQFS